MGCADQASIEEAEVPLNHRNPDLSRLLQEIDVRIDPRDCGNVNKVRCERGNTHSRIGFSRQKIASPARVELYSPLENTLLRCAVEIGATTKQLAEFDLQSQFQDGVCIENTFSSEPFGEGVRPTFPDQFCLSPRQPHRRCYMRYRGASRKMPPVMAMGLCQPRQ